MKAATVIYHNHCPDGWTAAWLMHKYLSAESYDDISLIGGSYGTPPPDVSGDVFLVDFCYEPEHLDRLFRQANTLTILDHHQTALEWVIETWGEDHVIQSWDANYGTLKGVVVLDQEFSGAMLAMLWTEQDYPFVKYIEDRDLWRFRWPLTPSIFSAVTSFEFTLENWDDIANLGVEALWVEGGAIERYRQKLIQDIIRDAWQGELLGHQNIWMVASPYAVGSDVAGELAKRDPERFAAYFVVKPEGVLRWGLRSAATGMDVATLAQTRGGGGHFHASGFETPLTHLTQD